MMKKRRICFVDYDMSVTGGVEQVTATLSNSLCEFHEVYVVSIRKGASQYHLSEGVHYVSVLEGHQRLHEEIKQFHRTFKVFLKKHHIDVAILMGNYAALVTALVKPFVKTKFIYCDHGGLMNQWKQKDITGIRFIDCLFANKVVTLTERTLEDYHRKFHIGYKKLECIYNWIEVDKNVQYNPDSKLIMSVGRFGKEKGYDLLVKVAKQFLEHYPEWQWHIYGDGECFEDIKERIQKLKLEKQLILMGNCSHIQERYRQYSFLVLPSYREGLPLVLLEAMAHKLPTISFDILTGPREIICDGTDGFLVEPYDTMEMANKIVQLIHSRELRCRFSEATVKGITKFSKEKILYQWNDLIDEISK